MDEVITYGVFWLSAWNSDQFTLFAGYFTKYEDAYKEYMELRKNPACIAARIVERVEHFEIVATTEAGGGEE